MCVRQLRAQCGRKLSGSNRGQVWEIVCLHHTLYLGGWRVGRDNIVDACVSSMQLN